MILSISEQVHLFALSILAGSAAGLLYDVFRILRIALPHPSILVQLEDIMYWVCITLGMFIFMMHALGGELRAYAIFGAFIGAVLYFSTLSLLIMNVSSFIIRVVKRLLAILVLAPLKFILGFCANLLNLLLKPLKFFLKKALQIGRIYGKIGSRKIRRDVAIILRKR